MFLPEEREKQRIMRQPRAYGFVEKSWQRSQQSRSAVLIEARALGKLAIPIALAQFGLMTMSLVDTAVLGRVSKIDLAAVALGRNIGFAAQTLSMGLAMALEPLASQAIGANDPKRAWRAYRSTLETITIAFVPVMILALVATFGLKPLGVDDVVISRTRQFLVAWAPGLYAFPCFIAGKTYLQSHSRTRPALVAAIVANVVNLVVCNLLVRGDDALASIGLPRVGLPRLGALGSGIALTVAGILLATMVTRGAFALRPSSLEDSPRIARREIVRLGMPVGMPQMLAEVGASSRSSACSPVTSDRRSSLQIKSRSVWRASRSWARSA